MAESAVSQEESLASQEETSASQEETPVSQEETPASLRESSASQEQTSASQEETPASQKAISASWYRTQGVGPEVHIVLSVFSSFSSLITALKDGKARLTLCILVFVILQLSDLSTSVSRRMKKQGCTKCILVFSLCLMSESWTQWAQCC